MPEQTEPAVTIPMSQFDRMRDQIRGLNEELRVTKAQLEDAKLADPNGTIKAYQAAFAAAVKVTQFAVANLEPATVSGWPHAALVSIANAIETLPGIDMHVKEVSPDMRMFAETARSYEDWRKERDANKVVMPATAADFGPKTPEALEVHTTHVARIAAAQESGSEDPVAAAMKGTTGG